VAGKIQTTRTKNSSLKKNIREHFGVEHFPFLTAISKEDKNLFVVTSEWVGGDRQQGRLCVWSARANAVKETRAVVGAYSSFSSLSCTHFARISSKEVATFMRRSRYAKLRRQKKTPS